MIISFAFTKEYEVWIKREEIDKEYGGDIKAAVKDKLADAYAVDSYVDDIEVLETKNEYEDELYEERLEDEYRREEDLQESLYLRDLI